MVLAAFFFSIMSVLVKLAGERLPTTQIVFARCVVSLVLSWWFLRRAGVRGWGKRKGLLLLRGLTGLGGLLCFFHATVMLPLADVTTLHYTNPVVTALLAGVLLGETLGRGEILGSLLSLVGVVLVAQPSFLFGQQAESLDPMAVLIALGGSVFSAFAYTTVRKLRETEPPMMVVFYFPLVATPVSIPLMWNEAVWPTPYEWLLLLGVGVVTQIAQVFLTRGLHAERAGRAMSMSYVQIIFAALWGALVFRDLPEPLTLMGAGLIVVGTLIVSRPRRAESRAP